MLFQNSQLIVMLVLILTVYQIHSTRQHRSSTKPNFKFAPASNRRYRKLENQEASIDVGNVISIVIPNNPHEMLNVEQLTEDFRNELERIKKQTVSSFKNGGPVGLFKVLNQPLYDETDKRQKNIPKEVRIPKSTSSNENLEVVAERDAFKDADFDRNARLVNDLARIAEQLANFRANENPPAGYLDQLTPSARNDLAAAAAQPLNINSSEDLRSNASVVVNEPKRLPEISADLIVYDYVPNKDTNDKRNGFYLPS
ncbi:uncharacterized protein LOC107264880 isoform X2 [Cephus cinctus]|uniref:Uncharacterized protein LOC107264880 isoform X2 n=1 Tax=Cephus cinctus TaxID=211228 RepID=A0AAJ7BLS3_CEPCN|nr:uncharacterized protein LOC107264880 isoform X2 [Cephus cinctus]